MVLGITMRRARDKVLVVEVSFETDGGFKVPDVGYTRGCTRTRGHVVRGASVAHSYP